RLCGKNRSLCCVRTKRPRCLTQVQNTSTVSTSSVGTCQAYTAPKIGLACRRKRVDRIFDVVDLRAVHKPQTTTQSLIKGIGSITGYSRRFLLPFYIKASVKVALMKTDSIDNKPPQQRVKIRKLRLGRKL